MVRLLRLVSACALAAVALVACAAATGTDVADESAQIIEVLNLAEGMRVADVGAGDGEWTEVLAEQVGSTGHVFATEVDEDDLEDLRERFAESGLDNVTSILGDDKDTGLSADCCDGIFLRLVYHHFTEPALMRASLRQALKPEGLIAVVDILPQTDWRDLPGVPDRGGHGIPPADLISEMTADGFDFVARFDDWGDDEDHYCVVFRRSGAT